MIIKCQEHYNKVVEYAKSIGDNTLQQCIERLQQWEKKHPIRSDSPKELPTGGQESSEGYSIMADRTNHTP